MGREVEREGEHLPLARHQSAHLLLPATKTGAEEREAGKTEIETETAGGTTGGA